MADEQSLQELGRNLTDFRNEYRSDRNQYIRMDLYRAEQAHVLSQLASVQAEQDSARKEALQKWSSLTNSIRAGLVTSTFAVLVALVVAWIK